MENATTTVIQIVDSGRDWLDVLVAVFTIVAGVALAIAAGLALVIQRSRYLGEIEPDLRVEDAEVTTESRANNASRSYPIIQVKYSIRNVSPNKADVGAVDAQLDAFGTGAEWFLTEVDRISVDDPKTILPNDEISERMSMLQAEEETYERFVYRAGDATSSQISFIASLRISFATPPDILTWILNFGRSRQSYSRNARIYFTIQGPETADPYRVTGVLSENEGGELDIG